MKLPYWVLRLRGGLGVMRLRDLTAEFFRELGVIACRSQLPGDGLHMRYNKNSLKGDYIGDI